MPRRALVVALALAATGCALAAREHPCWAYLDHQYQGHVPAELSHRLARERGTRRTVGKYRAPTGWYWRHRHASADVTDVRTVVGDWELTHCPVLGPPALPRAH